MQRRLLADRNGNHQQQFDEEDMSEIRESDSPSMQFDNSRVKSNNNLNKKEMNHKLTYQRKSNNQMERDSGADVSNSEAFDSSFDSERVNIANNAEDYSSSQELTPPIQIKQTEQAQRLSTKGSQQSSHLPSKQVAARSRQTKPGTDFSHAKLSKKQQVLQNDASIKSNGIQACKNSS